MAEIKQKEAVVELLPASAPKGSYPVLVTDDEGGVETCDAPKPQIVVTNHIGQQINISVTADSHAKSEAGSGLIDGLIGLLKGGA